MNLVVMLVAADVGIGWGQALGMYFRRSLTRDLVYAIIAAGKTNLAVSFDSLEAHSLAGGNPQAVVNSMLVLDAAGEDLDFGLLAALDLSDRDLPAITQAFIEARERFPDLTFTEVLARHGRGEDIVTAVADDTFLPRSKLGGWRVRLEHGPLTFDELVEGVASGRFPADSLVRDPESGEWLPVRRVVGEDPEG